MVYRIAFWSHGRERCPRAQPKSPWRQGRQASGNRFQYAARPYGNGGMTCQLGGDVDLLDVNWRSADALPGRPEVLVVDDDVSVCNALARLLRLQGHAVYTFRSAEAFLAQHDPFAWGCIVLDVAMPGLSGLALQQALQERGNEMPIV